MPVLHRIRLSLVALCCVVAISTAAAAQADSEVIQVTLAERDGGFVLLRDGKPYRIQGAGGRSKLDELVAAGGNSIRTWHLGNVGKILDRAHELGLSVTVGIWLGHERHGFDYNDEAKVAAQHREALKGVRRHKDHPAVLMWGIGNEMEGDGSNPKVWKAVNALAKAIKEVDPHHPTMTVIAGTYKDKVKEFVKYCPDIDVLGVNAYGDLRYIPKDLTRQGMKRPYVICEFGPYGWWDREKTSWGAEIEPTSTAKAATYLESYQVAVLDEPKRALGAYAFLWGHKQEHTHTWFGMFLPTGERTGAVDVMTKMWTGKWPGNRVPSIERFVFEPERETAASKGIERVLVQGSRVKCRVDGGDAEDAVTVRWELRRESTDKRSGGDKEEVPATIRGVVQDEAGQSCTLVVPKEAGHYRFFVFLTDGQGGAATANIPFRVE